MLTVEIITKCSYLNGRWHIDFSANSTHPFARIQAKNFEDMFLVKIASESITLKGAGYFRIN